MANRQNRDRDSDFKSTGDVKDKNTDVKSTDDSKENNIVSFVPSVFFICSVSLFCRN